MGGALSTLIAFLLAGPAIGDLPAGVPPPSPAAPAPPARPVEDDPPIVLSWSAPAECPGVEELRAEIRRLAGSVPAPPELPEAHATVKRGARETWQLTLTTRAGALGGERKLTAPDCPSLMRAAALVMALMINPSAGAPAPEPPPPPPPPPPQPVVVAPAPPRERPLGPFAAGADLLVGTGMLPGGPAPGIGLRIGLHAVHLSIDLRANLWASRSAASPSDASTGGSFDLFDFGLAGCASARRERRLAPGVCLGAAVLRAHATGSGVSAPGEATAWWPGAFVEGNVRFRLTTRNAVRVAFDALLPFGHPTFALGGIGAVFAPAAFGARGTLGWELNF